MGQAKVVETPEDRRAIAQTETIIAADRAKMLDVFLNDKDRKDHSMTTTGQRTESGLQLDTKVDEETKPSSRIIVSGDTKIAREGFAYTDLVLSGDFKITHVKQGGNTVEHDHFRMSQGLIDTIYDRGTSKRATLQRQGADGKMLQQYYPAVSEVQYKGGKALLDPRTGQEIQIAHRDDSATNCGPDNPANPGNKRYTCSYIMNDPKYGDLSINQTSEQFAAGIAYKSVIRDLKGTVIGIADQFARVNGNGDVTEMTTSIHAPREKKR